MNLVLKLERQQLQVMELPSPQKDSQYYTVHRRGPSGQIVQQIVLDDTTDDMELLEDTCGDTKAPSESGADSDDSQTDSNAIAKTVKNEYQDSQFLGQDIVHFGHAKTKLSSTLSSHDFIRAQEAAEKTRVTSVNDEPTEFLQESSEHEGDNDKISTVKGHESLFIFNKKLLDEHCEGLFLRKVHGSLFELNSKDESGKDTVITVRIKTEQQNCHKILNQRKTEKYKLPKGTDDEEASSKQVNNGDIASEENISNENCIQEGSSIGISESIEEDQNRQWNKKPYKCTICSKLMFQCIGKEPWKCTSCNVGFMEAVTVFLVMQEENENKIVSFARSCNLFQHKKTEERQHVCDRCAVNFPDGTALQEHHDVCQERHFSCYLCGICFTKNCDLIAHRKSHKKGKVFKCNVCNAKLDTEGHLLEHKRTHRDKLYKCDICGVGFARKYAAEMHKSKHAKEELHICDVCGVGFTKQSHLQAHRKVHAAEKPFKCEFCERAFLTSAQLLVHRKRHTGEKPHQCNTCGQEFNRSSDLRKHERKHTGEKPYACDVCGSRFSQSSHLSVHKRSHTGDKPYRCYVCSAAFTSNTSLKYHIRSHTGEKPYKCDVCTSEFARKSVLKKHLRMHADKKA